MTSPTRQSDACPSPQAENLGNATQQVLQSRVFEMIETAGRLETLGSARDHVQDAASIGFLEHYGARLAGLDRRVPCHAEMRSGGLTAFLPYMAVMDCRDRLAPRFLSAGAKYIEFFGTDPTGRDYLDFVPTSRTAAALESFDHCMRLPCAMTMRIVGVSVAGQQRFTETVGVPVAAEPAGPPAFLYLTSVVLTTLGRNEDTGAFSKRVAVTGRRFVDIGFGCPSSFLGQDLS
jgi:hypothetical protein